MKTSCAIIISHYESLPFLRACVRQIRKYKHPDIIQEIIIADQSGGAIHNQLMSEFESPDIAIVWMKPLYSGYGIDYVMRFVEIPTEYICQLHVDAFPIHKNWLYLSIKLMQENNFAFVGQNHFITKPTDTKYYYLKNMFYHMSPTFNISRTEIYKEMALNGGFTRYHERKKIDVPMTFLNKDWDDWASHDYDNRGSDDDVVASCWADNYREYDKLGLATNFIIGAETPEEPGFGRIIDDIVFHFGFCRESIGVKEFMGSRYLNFSDRIKNGFDDDLLNELLLLAKQNPKNSSRTVWNGKFKKAYNTSEELNKKIEELKNE